MVKRSIWDWLVWVVLAGILVWIILKMLGVINTPVLLEYAPYLGAVYLAGWYAQRIEGMSNKIDRLIDFKEQTVKKINNIEMSCVRNHG